MAAAAGTNIVDNAVIAAHRVSVYRVVYRAVADPRFLHAADHAFKGVDVLAHVAVQLHIADMARVGQGVEGRFLPDLFKGVDGIIHRHMEGVGVIIPVRHAGDLSKLLLVDAHKGAGKPLRRCGQQRKVQAGFLGLVVHALAHIGDDLQAQLVAFLAFAVVLAGQGFQGFRQADKAHGKSAVLQKLRHGIVAAQLFRIDPHALAHQEGIIIGLLTALDLETVQKLLNTQVDALVQDLVKFLDIALGLNADARQVYGGKAQVSPAAGCFPLSVVDVAHDSGAAAHIGNFGIVISGLVILQVEGRVNKAEIGEQPLGGNPHGQLEQVVVGVTLVVVDTLLYLEDLHRENGGLPVSQAVLCGQQQVPNDHSALLGGVGTVIQRREGNLGARSGIHGVQIVHQSLHGLEGSVVSLPPGGLPGITRAVEGLFRCDLLKAVFLLMPGQILGKFLPVFLGLVHGNGMAQLFLCRSDQSLGVLIGHSVVHPEEFDKGLEILLAIGLIHTLSHGVIEDRHALAAMHLILVCLNGDTGQGGIAADIVWLPQIAVTGGKTAFEQLDQVDLAAGFRQRVKILIVNVDIPINIGSGDLRRDHVFFIEALGAL